MNINKNNYEAFFLDYHEGNLSPQQVADLLLFVEQHTELKEEFESFENISVVDEKKFNFENKETLKKLIDSTNIEKYLINSIEGNLNKAEQNLFDDFIKHHPNYLLDLNLFLKTKSSPDFSIVFENKDQLKKDLIPALFEGEGEKLEHLLISSVEGLLSDKEASLLNQQLASDAKSLNDLAIYQQTKLIADTSITYKNKEELYRKERKVIPLFYYVAAAASIALLFSMYILLNDNSTEQKFAVTPTDSVNKIQNNTSNTLANKVIEKEKNSSVESVIPTNNSAQFAIKKEKKRINNVNSIKKDSVKVFIELGPNNQQLTNNNQQQQQQQQQQPTTNNQQPVTNNQETIAKIENDKSKEIPAEFLSLRELAAEKIKEKTLDENTIASQKISGKNKKISGWDVAQIVSKGISKLTGRDLEVKPTYNEQGDVTAYAFGNGLHVSKGR